MSRRRTANVHFPGPEPAQWDAVSADEAGWSGDHLEEVARYCETHSSHQLVVLVSGRLLLERYWAGAGPTTTADVASLQKSVVSLLLGILHSAGVLSSNDPVTRWLGRGWSRARPAQEDQILLRHLSSMTSGLYDDFTVEAAPDSVWYYNNNAYHQLRKVIEAATDAPTQQAFDRLLAHPLGLHAARWRGRPAMTDPNGSMLEGLHASARHLARVGLCVLAGGRWADTTLVDEAVLAAALQPSQSLNPSYGHLWWLPTQPSSILPGGPLTDRRKAFGGYRREQPIVCSAPSDLVAGFGAGGQRLYVCRSLDAVVVRLGPAPLLAEPDHDFDEELWQRLSSAAGVAAR